MVNQEKSQLKIFFKNLSAKKCVPQVPKLLLPLISSILKRHKLHKIIFLYYFQVSQANSNDIFNSINNFNDIFKRTIYLTIAYNEKYLKKNIYVHN